jgi:hypothetical protein
MSSARALPTARRHKNTNNGTCVLHNLSEGRRDRGICYNSFLKCARGCSAAGLFWVRETIWKTVSTLSCSWGRSQGECPARKYLSLRRLQSIVFSRDNITWPRHIVKMAGTFVSFKVNPPNNRRKNILRFFNPWQYGPNISYGKLVKIFNSKSFVKGIFNLKGSNEDGGSLLWVGTAWEG